jgi:hypothetical protein
MKKLLCVILSAVMLSSAFVLQAGAWSPDDPQVYERPYDLSTPEGWYDYSMDEGCFYGHAQLMNEIPIDPQDAVFVYETDGERFNVYVHCPGIAEDQYPKLAENSWTAAGANKAKWDECLRRGEIKLSVMETTTYTRLSVVPFVSIDDFDANLPKYLIEHNLVPDPVVPKEEPVVYEPIDYSSNPFDYKEADGWLCSKSDYSAEDITIAIGYNDNREAQLYVISNGEFVLSSTEDDGTWLSLIDPKTGFLAMYEEQMYDAVCSLKQKGEMNLLIMKVHENGVGSDIVECTPVPVIFLSSAVTEFGDSALLSTPVPDAYLDDIPVDIPGDTDYDGKVNARDVLEIMHYLVGKGRQINKRTADYNSDGRINSRDVLNIMFDMVNGD